MDSWRKWNDASGVAPAARGSRWRFPRRRVAKRLRETGRVRDGRGRLVSLFVVFLACLLAFPACTFFRTRSPGDRISYEEKVGRQFGISASGHFRWIDEPEVLDFVKTIGHMLTAQLEGSPYDYRFYVVRDPTMNAFAVPGGYICIFAGLISQVDTVEGLAGVMAHEISHVEGNHFIRGQQKMDMANIAAVAGMILAAAFGGGQGAAAGASLAQAAQSTASLHYSRQFEREADRNAIRLVVRAGFDPNGMLAVFKRFQAIARLNAANLPPYFYTHPLPVERIYEVEGWIKALHVRPRTRPRLRMGFDLARVTARLRTQKPDLVIADQAAKVRRNPADVHARFLLGYLHLKRGNLEEAEQYLEEAVRKDSSVVEHLLYLARAYELEGRWREAEILLDKADEMDPQCMLLEIFYGDLLAQQDEWEEALHHYRRAVVLNPKSSTAHASLAMAYERMDRRGESYLELAISDKLAGRYLKALHYFKKSLDHLDASSRQAKRAKEEIAWMGG